MGEEVSTMGSAALSRGGETELTCSPPPPCYDVTRGPSQMLASFYWNLQPSKLGKTFFPFINYIVCGARKMVHWVRTFPKQA